MQIGDLLVKLNRGGQLTPEEEQAVSLWANSLESQMAFVSGIQNGRSDIFANSITAINQSFTPIRTIELFSDTATFQISVPPNANNLLIMGSVRTDMAAYNDSLVVRFNNDTDNNYMEQYEGAQNTTQIQGGTASQSYATISLTTANSSTASALGSFFAFLPDVRGERWKSVISVCGTPSYSATDMITRTTCSFWKNTTPIKTIDFLSANSANIKTTSFVSIYGIL